MTIADTARLRRVRSFLPVISHAISAPGLADIIASHGYGNDTTAAADAIYREIEGGPAALAAMVAEVYVIDVSAS